MRKIKLGVLIYTYDRVDDARINMEIIRHVWQRLNNFATIKIVHAFNGKKNWYQKKYLEDDLVRVKNVNHFQGAAELIDAGMSVFSKKYTNLDYIVVLAADTWLVKPDYLENIVDKLVKNALYLATCPWGFAGRNVIHDVGMATDFFVMDWQWVKNSKMFPLKYEEFHKKYGDLFLYQSGGRVMLEKLAFAKFIKANGTQYNGMYSRDFALSKTLLLKERMPVHLNAEWLRKHYWPRMGLLTHHEAEPKRKILKKMNINVGKYLEKLVTSDNLDYFNPAIKKV